MTSCTVVSSFEGQEVTVVTSCVLDVYFISPLQVVVEVCCHGESDKVIGQLKEREEMAVDLLI